MNKKIFTILLTLFLSTGLYAGIFELYGVGKIGVNYSVAAQGRGKTSVAYSDSLSYNMQNPANLAHLKKAGIEVSVENSFNSIENVGYTNGYTGFSYGMLKFPLADKGGFALGLTPITSSHASYQIMMPDSSYWETASSEGNIYAATIGVAYSFFKKGQLSIGASAEYLIGGYNIVKEMDFYSPSLDAVKIESDEGFNGWQFTGGISFSPIKEISLGASYTHVSNTTRRQITNYMVGSTSSDFYSHVDTVEYNNIKLFPNRFSVGLAFMPTPRYIFTLDWMQYQFGSLSSDFSFNPFYEGSQVHPFNHYGLGFERKGILSEYVPYYKSLTYRGGVYFEEQYMANSEGVPVKTYGVSLGLGLPFTEYSNRLDLAFTLEYNSGTIYEIDGINPTPINLNELVYRFNLSITIAENWFKTRGKYR